MGLTKFPSCTAGLSLSKGFAWREAAEKVRDGLIVLPDREYRLSTVAILLGVNRSTFFMWFKIGVLSESLVITYNRSHKRVNCLAVGKELVKKLSSNNITFGKLVN